MVGARGGSSAGAVAGREIGSWLEHRLSILAIRACTKLEGMVSVLCAAFAEVSKAEINSFAVPIFTPVLCLLWPFTRADELSILLPLRPAPSPSSRIC